MVNARFTKVRPTSHPAKVTQYVIF
jgi:hypothetical protein